MIKYTLFSLFLLISSLFSQESKEANNKKDSKPLSYLEEVLDNEQDSSNGRFFNEFLHMLLSLAFIIGLLYLVMFLLKKFLHSKNEQINVSSRIKILEQRSLSSKASLYLLSVDNQTVLIAESQTSIHPLSQLKLSRNTFEEHLKNNNSNDKDDF